MGKKNKKQQNATDNNKDKENESNSVFSKDLILEKVDIRVPGKTLIKESDIRFAYGRKYGMIGINGSGKTTLLKSLVNHTFKIHSQLDIYYVEQEIPASQKTVYESVIESNSKRCTLLMEQLQLSQLLENDDCPTDTMKQYTQISEQLVLLNADKDESIVRKILHGLGFSTAEQNMETSSFSGGWRMRISLARALYLQPTILLLDEPTNHLDLNAAIWLTDYLANNWSHTLVVVSHNKDFINEVCTDVIHLYEHKLSYYKGNYDSYKIAFKQYITHRESEWAKLQRKVTELRNKSTPRKDITTFIEKSNVLQPLKPYTVNILFPSITTINNPAIEFNDVTFGYTKDKLIYNNLNFAINMDSRITIVGKNGVGKSTLLKLIATQLTPINGEILHNSRLKLGYYHQHSIEQLPLNNTPIEYIETIDPNLSVQIIRKYLGSIGLEGSVHNNKINTLSGGQKARVTLIALFVLKPHIILFDEPTNHLDIETIESLVKSISTYEGGVIMVTHDIDLIVKTNSELWEIKQSEIIKTTYESYRAQILDSINL